MQFGFINYADSVEGGIPIGFISVVRNGGYRAVEYSLSEFYPVNLGFKIGIEKFYSTIYVGYNPFDGFKPESFATGWGMGSILRINDSFFFNPELIQYSPVTDGLNYLSFSASSVLSLVPFFGYKLSDNFSVTVGPSISWVRDSNNEQYVPIKPFFKFAEYVFEGDDRNRSIVLGVRAAVRFSF
jgi:hypothetical protein